MKLLLQIIAMTLLFLSPSLAQSPDPDATPVTLSERSLSQIRKNPDIYVQRAIQRLFQITASGILTKDILDTYQKMQTAKTHSRLLGQVFEYDLNADLALDADEISAQMPLLNSQKKAQLQAMLATSDHDHDAALSLKEILAYVAGKATKSRLRNSDINDLMEFDANKDGQVTPMEIGTVVADLVARGDIRPIDAPTVPRDVYPACTFPTPSANSEIVLLSGYEGAAVSNVAVSGLDRETSLAVLNIEKGDTPLYIVTSAYDSIVWKLQGDVDRVETLVAGFGPRGVGVVGLKRETITFLPNKICVPKYYKGADSGGAMRAKGRISTRLKRDINHIIGAYRLGEIALPSGVEKEALRRGSRGGTIVIQAGKRYLLTDDGPKLLDGPSKDAGASIELRLLRDLHRYYPAGIAELAEKDVIASSKAQTYDVLPQQAGLLQLAREGALTITSDGYYLITKPIARFPAGLNGGHSVKFMLAKGVEIPAGSPGHSEVILEETGECVIGFRCR